ncbi:class I SAM-dependent methyltransferase [Pedobacter africanus]|uniref:Methyltransferase domain-containing protein n=1 Tax=Pedobacter africanus TaxID=151894 RepID=A0A1W2AIM1_9SPHI|nr:SAM-dependent methyltransferase [Pedobacter africanus]SMC60362.1 Methyltransferase domain-containing protein [Pedobacter africanus]
MSNQLLIQQFLTQVSEGISLNQYVKLSLGHYQGNEKELKNVYVRRIEIKRADMLSFTYRYKTRDIIKNFSVEEGITLIRHFISNDFKVCTLVMIEKEVILEYGRKGLISVREKGTTATVQPTLSHNKEKKRIIQAAGKTYLQELRISDAEGNVFKNAQDKYRQINQYVEILSSLIKELPAAEINKVVDMGSGKGYLTFALYDYLHHVLKLDSKVTGVEYREDLVGLCNGIAGNAGFNKLDFVQGTIEDYDVDAIDLLIALHACDTATDDAIYKGIQAGAQLIVVAPCCHKQIRREMEKHKAKNEFSFLTKYGIFMERQAEMVTDGIRALILEYFGYKTKVFEFISDAHTPKNVLVVGTRTSEIKIPKKLQEAKKAEIAAKIKEVKAYFGIGYHHLERLAGFDKKA